jgi:TonB family protein
MKQCSKLRRTLSLVCLAASFFGAPNVFAQEPGRELDDLGKRISKQIAKAGVHSIVVADFVSQSGSDSVQSRYIAEEFAQRLEYHKKKFALTERKQLSSALSDAKLAAKDLSAADAVLRIGSALGVDAIVTGTFETTSEQYSVDVTVRSVKDGGEITSGNQTIKRPAYVDSLARLDPGVGGSRIARAGMDGTGIPTCVVCPAPEYTAKAREEKIQARVVMLVVISEQGRAVKITVAKSDDSGLAARAAEAVRTWKFKPATDKTGHAVAVITPIEVTFRLY